MRGAVALAVCGLWLAGCARGPAPEIRFPSPGAKLANPVHLEASTEVRWFDGQAYLGQGRVWRGSLSPGTHRIRAEGAGEASLELEVEEDYPLDVIRAVPSGKAELDLPPGKYRVIWGNASGKPIQAGEPSARTQPPSHTPWHEPVRALERELLQKPQRKIELKPGKQLRGLPELGSKRSFRLLDLDSPGSEWIEARLVWAGANVLAYVHEAAGYDVNELAAAVGPIARAFDGEILERRGAAYLYLRYLMERAGGLALQNGGLVDKGGLRFTRRVIAERAASHQDVARLAAIEANGALWRYWWTLALSGEGRLAWAEFEPRVLDPFTGDYLGVDLRLGKVRLTPEHAFELNGVKPTLQWPSTLPPAAFALREVQGPCRLELPRAGAVQVLRVE